MVEIEPLTGQEPAPSGAALVAELVPRLPTGPGVYRMLAADGSALYVGKARNLKKRVASYARGTGHSDRIMRMINAIHSMEFVITQNEIEALLLEANMIRQLKPRFNVLLRDDKSMPYILITADHEAPRVMKHRGARNPSGIYYGPFVSAGAVNRTLITLQRAFLLRSCTDSYYAARSRPCLLYQIKRCCGPCTGEISLSDYQKLVGEARSFLEGRSQAVRQQLTEQMDDAARQLHYEQAAVYRDRLAALAHVQSHQQINVERLGDCDLFAVHQAGGLSCIQVFFFRNGQNWGNRAYFPRADKSISAAEVLAAFIAQFYDTRTPPPLILLSDALDEQNLLSEALSTKAARKVQVVTPRRGEKRNLVIQAQANARQAAERRLSDATAQRKLLSALAERLDLPTPPRRIEVYDNSHIQGSHAVGTMIVADLDGFSKAHYRKFNMPHDLGAPGDDYAMMRHMLERRFLRLQKENPKRAPNEPVGNESRHEAAEGADAAPWPDLVVIDGGAGQLSVAIALFAELGIADIPLLAVAKGTDRDAGRERFFAPGRQPIMLKPGDPVLYFMQRLRDEAHRFAIGSHRVRRKKALSKSGLDDVVGIGPKRKRALLRHFGSVKAVANASPEDLRTVEGIDAQLAQIVYDFFHDQ